MIKESGILMNQYLALLKVGNYTLTVLQYKHFAKNSTSEFEQLCKM